MRNIFRTSRVFRNSMRLQRRQAGTGSTVAGAVSGILALGAVAGAGVYYGLGASTNANDEEIRKAIADILDKEGYDDGSMGPVFVRLAWHASGTYCASSKTGGSCGATMRFSPEKEDGANAGLDVARAALEPIKEQFPDLSYADLWILSGYVAIEEMGGPKIPFRYGRKDAVDGNETSKQMRTPPNGRLPDAALGAAHIRDVFYRMGMNDQDIVALVGGGHALGRCHTDRSGFDGPWTRAPTTFSNEYFRLLFEDKWTPRRWDGPKQFENRDQDLMMLPTDMANITDPDFRKWSEIYYKDYDRFEKDFASAWKKLTELGM